MSRKNIWLDGIMGVVVGDALGVPVEFVNREKLTKCPVEDMRGFGTYNMPRGNWSDDSSMTLATLDSLKNGYDPADIMDRFVMWIDEGMYTPFEAALWCLINTDTYKACTLKAVNLGSDTETVAAIAGGLSGLYYGYVNIPKDWLDVIKKRDWIEKMCE